MLEKGKVSFPLTNSWYIASFYVGNGCTLFGEDGKDEEAGIDFAGEKGAAVTKYLVNLVGNKNFVMMSLVLAFLVCVMEASMQCLVVLGITPSCQKQWVITLES